MSAVQGRKWDTVSGLNPWAVGRLRDWAEWDSWGPFHIFLFFLLSFFCFLISLITFANLVQFASNQLCKVSKIQNNILEQ
jgi:hypothetical protein